MFDLRVHLQPPRRKRVVALNANPRSRGAASRILNREAEAFIRHAQNIARDEFRLDRSESRRPNPGSPRFSEAFELGHNTQAGINRQVVQMRNTATTADGRPLWPIVEFGANAHVIRVRDGRKWLRFPIYPPVDPSRRVSTPGGPPGSWALNSGRPFKGKAVEHPGSPAFGILRRAKQRYHQTERSRSTPRRRG